MPGTAPCMTEHQALLHRKARGAARSEKRAYHVHSKHSQAPGPIVGNRSRRRRCQPCARGKRSRRAPPGAPCAKAKPGLNACRVGLAGTLPA